MSHLTRIALAAAATLLIGLSNSADARGYRYSHYPLTRCGPDLTDLCPLHGYFDGPPFHYHVAVYPGCVRVVQGRRVLVCEPIQRPMIWW